MFKYFILFTMITSVLGTCTCTVPIINRGETGSCACADYQSLMLCKNAVNKFYDFQLTSLQLLQKADIPYEDYITYINAVQTYIPKNYCDFRILCKHNGKRIGAFACVSYELVNACNFLAGNVTLFKKNILNEVISIVPQSFDIIKNVIETVEINVECFQYLPQTNSSIFVSSAIGLQISLSITLLSIGFGVILL